MVPFRLALLCALGVALLTPQAAAGGGWWSSIDVNRSTVAPGQRVEVDETVAFNSKAAAEEARDGFYVYLLRDFDYSVVERAMRNGSPRNWWSLGAAEAIQVGQVEVSVSDANLARATAAFTVPELPPAAYDLMLCDAGCAEPLAGVVPVQGFTVVADPATAQITQRVDRFEHQVRDKARQLAATRADTESALAAAQNARSKVGGLEVRVSSLADESRSSPRWLYAGWVVAGVGVLVGARALLVRRRRSRASRTAQVAGWRPSDDELRELLSSGPTHRR